MLFDLYFTYQFCLYWVLNDAAEIIIIIRKYPYFPHVININYM